MPSGSRFALIAVAAVVAVALSTCAAVAHAAPQVIVWSGALSPGHPATGVEVRADGTGRRLRADAAGAVASAGAVSLDRAELAVVRADASALLRHGLAVTHVPELDGGYTTVLLKDGDATKAVTDTGADARAVTALLTAVNRALAPSARLVGAGRKGTAPGTAACPSGQQATEFSKEIPLPQAAAAGLVQLTPKGAISGDSMRVDATWKDLAVPARVVVHLEVESEPDDPTRYAAAVRNRLAAEYRGYVVDGQPVNFTFDVVDRERGSAPRPCYHEVLMHARDDVRSYVTDSGPSPQGGEWSAQDSGAWAHETAHLLGLPDEYDDYFHSDEKNIDFPLPVRGLEGDELQSFLTSIGLNAALGHVYSKPHSLYEHDLLGIAGSARLNPFDLGRLLADAPLVITDVPGDVLVSKDARAQNFVTGAPFALTVPPNGTAHVNGLVAYCIDVHRDPPSADGAGYDVLGPAGALGGAAMDALQRVADAVAAHEPGPLLETPGGGDAIWRVTDDVPVSDDPTQDATRAILQAAGVPPDTDGATFAAPHFTDPDAGDPATAALSAGDPAAIPPPAVQGAEPAAAPPPALTALLPSGRHLRLGARQGGLVVGARVTLTGSGDRVSLLLIGRRGRSGVIVARAPAVMVARGESSLVLVARHVRAGRYRLVARGARSGARAVTVTVTRS